MPIERMSRLLTTSDLARRWSMSEKTLRNMRWRGVGPACVKLGRLVRYPLDEIIAWEEAHLGTTTAGGWQ